MMWWHKYVTEYNADGTMDQRLFTEPIAESITEFIAKSINGYNDVMI